jgi:LytTr DNA-binding domain-containing protein
MLRNLKNVFSPLFSQIRLTIWVVGSATAAVAGPFGTSAIHNFPTRFFYWFLVFSTSTVLASVCNHWVKRLMGEERPILNDLAKVVFMVVVFSPFLFVMTSFISHGTLLGGTHFFIYCQSVAAISAAVCIIRRLLPWFEEVPYRKVPTQSTTISEPLVAEPRLTRRLPNEYEGPILRLAVRDHFVDVVTVKSTHTIRLRFLDAIDEMDNVEGYCTHRSHWVARGAVIQAERESGRIFLRMVNQDLVPVSRKYKPELEAAGIV